MKIIEVTVTEGFVEATYANGATKETSSEWIHFHLGSPGDDNRRLGVIQLAALRRLRTLVDDEMNRLRSLADQLREAPDEE